MWCPQRSQRSLPAAQAIAGAKSIPTLRRFAMNGKTLTDADLTALTSMTQLESLSLEDIDLPDARLPQLQAFAHLKTLTLVRYGKGYPEETQAKVNALLPKVEVGIGESLNLIRFLQYSANYRAINWLPAGYIVVWPEVR